MSQEMHYEDRMSDSDALMWTIEKDPMLRSTITTVMLFDSVINRDELTYRFERLSRRVPRLRQRVRGNPISVAPPRWEIDPHFDLHFHLWWVRAAGKGTMRDVLSIAEPVAMSGFDRARPLWRAVIVEGLPQKRSAIIMKIHHAITDGVGGMALQLELFDMDQDAPRREMPSRPKIHVMTQTERAVDAAQYEGRRQFDTLKQLSGGVLGGLAGALSDPLGAAAATGDVAASVGRVLRPVSHPMSPLMTGRSLSARFDTVTIPLDRTKAASKVAGGKLNDAFVGGITRGLFKYHLAHGIDVDELRMAIPINIRTESQEGVAGNAFVPARIEIPIDAESPLDSMRQARELVANARHEPANDLVQPLSGLLNRLPTSAVTALFGSMVKAVDFTTSNVPGAPFPVYLAGSQMLAQFPFGPLAGAALNVTLLSYQNDLNIGIASDPDAVPDPELLVSSVEEAFDEILSVADGKP